MQLKSSLIIPAFLACLAAATSTSSPPEISGSSSPLVQQPPTTIAQSATTLLSSSDLTESNTLQFTTSGADLINTQSHSISDSISNVLPTVISQSSPSSNNNNNNNNATLASSASSADQTGSSSRPESHTSKGDTGRATTTAPSPGSTPTSINAAGRSQFGLAVLGLAVAAGLGL